MPSTCLPICGDGLNVAGEICDDGDVSGVDKCKTDCSNPVTGWTCSGGSILTPKTCVPTCGDGVHLVQE